MKRLRLYGCRFALVCVVVGWGRTTPGQQERTATKAATAAENPVAAAESPAAAAGSADTAATKTATAAGRANAAESADKYTWLEDVSGERAMKWVKAENARTAAVLRADPHFLPFQADALRIAEDKRRLPWPRLRGSQVDNFWRDEGSPRGILRTTTASDYAAAEPHWRTLLDVDALNKAEGASWVWKGMEVLRPGDRFALVRLAAGGEDAEVVREFDLESGTFVKDGFTLPRSKQTFAWVDHDTLLVARDWGPGTMTAAGYPFVVKRWKRGTPLESAREVFRGKPEDEDVAPHVLRDSQGHVVELFEENVTFFESATFLQTSRGVLRLAVPAKASVEDLLDGELLIHLHQDWTPGQSGTPGQSAAPGTSAASGTSAVPRYTQGSLLSVHLADAVRDPAHLQPEVVFAPTATEFLDEVDTCRSRLIATTLNHVQGNAYSYAHVGSGWKRQTLAVPPNASVSIYSADKNNDTVTLKLSGFLTPNSLLLGDASQPASLATVKAEPARFDATGLVVEQLSAKSKDGTEVPYFVVHRTGLKYDGSNPTLLNAYGGFEVSMTPLYDAVLGKLWLDRGGVYVLANIRGGGEFGPAWHEAGLKTNRQRIYDDFAAVGHDLVTRGMTSPQRLGIMGGSNGGLLMGVEMEQNPTLWKAVVIQVPLLDMLGYEHIAAGASWVGEYGSVSVPKERQFLASISPYNQLKPGVQYPEPLIFTTTKDDRVGPQHARKFAAKMEEFHEPFFFDEITEGGHGAGADLKQEATTDAEMYVYLSRKLME